MPVALGDRELRVEEACAHLRRLDGEDRLHLVDLDDLPCPMVWDQMEWDLRKRLIRPSGLIALDL